VHRKVVMPRLDSASALVGTMSDRHNVDWLRCKTNSAYLFVPVLECFLDECHELVGYRAIDDAMIVT
jgi:hypothetical protein